MFPFKKAMAGKIQTGNGGEIILGGGVVSQELDGGKLGPNQEKRMPERKERGLDGVKSLGEEDLLARSTKKPKGTGIDDDAMDDPMLDNVVSSEVSEKDGQPDQHVIPPKSFKDALTNRKVVSCRDKLLQINGSGYESDSEEENWIEKQKREEEDDEDEELATEEVDLLCPTLQFSKAEQKEACKKWRSALIIKLLGKKIGTRFLMSRLLNLWSLVGTFELIDLDNGHLLIKFHDPKDHSHVLHEGP